MSDQFKEGFLEGWTAAMESAVSLDNEWLRRPDYQKVMLKEKWNAYLDKQGVDIPPSCGNCFNTKGLECDPSHCGDDLIDWRAGVTHPDFKRKIEESSNQFSEMMDEIDMGAILGHSEDL